MAGASDPSWGEQMGAWKVLDYEMERLTRAEAAVGAGTMAKLKHLNILVVGCQGTGVETAKNLILSNVGGVMIWDPEPTTIRDLGANFYLSEAGAVAGTPRAAACLSDLKSLNPYCKVEMWPHDPSAEAVAEHGKDVMGTGKPLNAIIVTRLLPKAQLFGLNEYARNNGIAFVLAITNGVTASIFSDFGPEHVITDRDGEPMKTLALRNCEVIDKPACLKIAGVDDGTPVVILTFAGDLGPSDVADITQLGADIVELDDNSGAMAEFNTKQFKVARVEFVSPSDAKVDVTDGMFKTMLVSSTQQCVEHWSSQFASYKAEFDKDAKEGAKFKTREITIMNRLALVATAEPVVDAATGQAKPGEYAHNAFDVQAFREYVAGGLVNPQKEVHKTSYKSLSASLDTVQNPQLLLQESMLKGDGIDCHLAISAVLDFHEQQGRWPTIRDDKDAAEVVAMAQKISDARQSTDGTCWAQAMSWGFPSGEARPVDGARIGRFAKLYGTELTGFCAYLGGAVAQEVMKKTGKYLPVNGWIHHEDHSLVTDESPTNIAPLGTRYDNQIMILGKDFQVRCANQKVFMVGCGALGCEYLKGVAMMGVGVGRKGKVTVTDNDVIEISNLSRQFLFRSKDVGSIKSIAGAKIVQGWNPQMNVNGIAHFVGDDTDTPGKEEQYFTDDFWEDLDVCWNALDNVSARQYTDKCCAKYSKPLLESGTLGTKCNGDTFLPFRTKTYNDDIEVEENTIAMCTLKGAPYLPLHCIEYAKQAMFSDAFEFAPQQYEDFRSNRDQFFSGLADMSTDAERHKALSGVKFFVDKQKSGAIDFTACIRIAFERLMWDFRADILARQHAGDEKEKQGSAHWTGTKRRPRPVEYSPDNAHSMEYLYAAANLYAFSFGIDYVKDRAEFDALVRGLGLVQPAWAPGAPVSEEEDDEAVDPAAVAKLKEELSNVDLAALQEAQAHDFEKDDDSNFHVDYLTIATNLRAWNFQIKETARAKVKVTAGKIMPALATTTAMVCGLVDIEFCKLVLGLQNCGSDKFLNCNINLALGAEAFSAFNPEEPIRIDTNLPGMPTYTVWDTVTVEGDLTGNGLAQTLQQRFPGLVIKELHAVSGKGGGGGVNKRVKKELADLVDNAISGIAVNQGEDESGDKNVVHARIAGPAGSPYEGGTFLVEVRLPEKFPNKAPSVSFVTPIYHCNIDKSGVPCPALLFGGGGWTPSTNIRTVLMQLVQLMRDCDPGSALRADLGALCDKDPAAYAAEAKKFTAEQAAADLQFSKKKAATPALWLSEDGEDGVPISAKFLKMRSDAFAESAKKKGKKLEPPRWPHDYIIVNGDFVAAGGDGEAEVSLPRIKLVFRHEANREAANAQLMEENTQLRAKLQAIGGILGPEFGSMMDVNAASGEDHEDQDGGNDADEPVTQPAKKARLTIEEEPVEPLDPALEAKVLALELTLDDEPLAISSCYKLSSARASRYACMTDTDGNVLFAALGQGGIAVTAKDSYGDTVETILDNDLNHCISENPIMMTEATVTSCVEAQFGEGGDWTVGAGDLETLQMEQASLFKNYETMITAESPECLSALRRMLQSSPVGNVFAQGRGFTLRMPEEDLEQFQTVNESGKVTHLPRPSVAVRAWNAETRSYDDIPNRLEGGPASVEEAEAWYAQVIKGLKNSPYLGPERVDQLVTSTAHEWDEPNENWVFPTAGTFSNKWTEIALATSK